MNSEINGIHIDAFRDESGRMAPCIYVDGQPVPVQASDDELNEIVQFEEANQFEEAK